LEAKNELRRHLSPWDLRELRLVRARKVAEKVAGGKSTRQVAAEEGISQTRVQQMLKLAREQGGYSPAGGTVTGRDGKTYPASRKKGRKTKEPDVEPAPEQLLDGTGYPVPERLRGVFEDGSLAEAAGHVEAALAALARSTSAAWLVEGVGATLKRAARQLRE